MTEQQQHPITPPPELVREWWQATMPNIETSVKDQLCTQAARWGADQELEACVKWIEDCWYHPSVPEDLRDARRPKPPSLAEQALAELDQIPTHDNEGRTVGGDVSIIRAALERLQELESNG